MSKIESLSTSKALQAPLLIFISSQLLLLAACLHVFVVIYGSFVIKYLNLNHKLSAKVLKSI